MSSLRFPISFRLTFWYGLSLLLLLSLFGIFLYVGFHVGLHSELEREFGAAATHSAWLEMTRRESAIHNELHRLQWLLLGGGALAILIAVAAGHWLARSALKPVATLTEAANRIQSGDLAGRVPTDFRVRDELSDLADTFNRMLERIQAAFERERQFRADTAHELFTPLTGLQSEIDVALQKPRESGYYEGSLLSARGHTQRMSATLDGLLELSRAESGTSSDSQFVDVGPFVLGCLRKFESTMAAAGLELDWEIRSTAEVSIDPNHLAVIVENLIDNAIKYTPAGGRIHVTVANDKDELILKVSDTGIGFESSEQGKLFDRFYRSDARQVRDSKGSGLGLSIVKTLVERYGGRVTASSGGRDEGSVFEVRLPGVLSPRHKARET